MNLNCVICADLFNQSDDVYVTPCGHIFHYSCLCQWLERSKSCPQCRNTCSQRNIHRIYFNIANLDASRIDIGSLQQQLDDMKLQIQEKNKERKRFEEEIEKVKLLLKKSMKTITGLEKDVAKKDLLIFSYDEQINRLKTNNEILKEQSKEINELKEKIHLMTTIQEVLTSTTAEVEKMLKEENNVKTLTVWVTALKRELRSCENKKVELRQALKTAQNDFRREHKLQESLKEKISHLESENYRMLDVIKGFESQMIDVFKSDEHSSLQSLKPIDRNLAVLQNIKTSSPSISERIKIIEDSNSPYLNIKSSSVGLTELLKHSENIRTNADCASNTRQSGILKETTSDLSEKYSIFKKARLEVHNSNLKDSNLSFNGVGGSEKDNYTEFLRLQPAYPKKAKPSLSERLKRGKLKKLLASSSSENQSRENIIPK